ncbi:uncharacterized protein Triagg1_7820 [Trichoderma aggressivum f. europaeum]|uniref:Uncharacterized protein n=1 Tax=Trichoderma aggressivum f. europaeum TaxID=173218 RepID=A0AAE1LXI6_9HYPO|nr:hypothetical protein Triagg1_7820 [Trichoderma aggressivum f. europaeum]
MLLVAQAIQTPQRSTRLPALVDPANECIRSATEMRSAESGLRNANCERLEGIKVVERGGKGSRKAPPAWLRGTGTGTGLGEFGGASRFGTDLRRRLLQAIDKRKKVQPGNRRYRYLASSAVQCSAVQQLPRASQKQQDSQAPFVYG